MISTVPGVTAVRVAPRWAMKVWDAKDASTSRRQSGLRGVGAAVGGLGGARGALPPAVKARAPNTEHPMWTLPPRSPWRGRLNARTASVIVTVENSETLARKKLGVQWHLFLGGPG